MSWLATFLIAAFGGFVGCMIFSIFAVSGGESRLEEVYRQGVQDGIAKAEARRMVMLGADLEADEEAAG